uniref:Uncharacterized protein n=1 Tax=Pseudonaja textilis TaxID=8673 RepID=A0A670XN56_PSETE
MKKIMNCQRPLSAYLPAAIAALSLSLPGSHLSPETFRQAKFDQPQCTAKCLLSQLLLKCVGLRNSGSCCNRDNLKSGRD